MKEKVKVDSELVESIIGAHILLEDVNKVAAWFNTPNMNFGNVSPITLFNRNRGHKVLQFIDNRLTEIENQDIDLSK